MQLNFPLLVDTAESSAALTLTKSAGWVKKGEGFVCDGLNTRLSTTAMPSAFQSATAALGMQITVRGGTYVNITTADTIIALTNSSGSSKADIVIGADTGYSSLGAFLFRCVTSGGTQTKQLGRPGWQFMGKSHGGASTTTCVQAVCVLDATRVLYSVHFNDTLSRIYEVDRSTWTVLRQFDFPVANAHIANIDIHPTYGTWCADYTTGKIFQIDLEQSLSTGAAVILKSWTAVSGLSGLCLFDIGATTYLAFGKYATSQQSVVMVNITSIVDGGTYVAATHKVKSFVARGYIQGIVVHNGLMYESSNDSTGMGIIDQLDITTFMASGTDGADYTTILLKNFSAPTCYPEDLSFDENGYLWCGSESFASSLTVEGQTVWRRSLTDDLPNTYTINYDGTYFNIYQNGLLHYASVALTPTSVPTCLAIGGKITATPGTASSPFAMARVSCVRVQDSVIAVGDITSIAAGTLETRKLAETAITVSNPGAELGTTTGWTNETGAIGVRSALPLPWTGSYYFFGGVVASSVATQVIDLVAAGLTATAIDGGLVGLILRWRQANYDATADPGYMGIRFLNASSTLISSILAPSVYTGPPLVWNNRYVAAAIPANTRYATLVMGMTRTSGTNCDTYIDDISLAFSYISTSTPHPVMERGAFIHLGTIEGNAMIKTA